MSIKSPSVIIGVDVIVSLFLLRPCIQCRRGSCTSSVDTIDVRDLLPALEAAIGEGVVKGVSPAETVGQLMLVVAITDGRVRARSAQGRYVVDISLGYWPLPDYQRGRVFIDLLDIS
jgi:hypothetical protein